MLSEPEREVAEYFCLFVAGADAAAVAHVCPRFAQRWQQDPQAAADQAGDVLRALVDKSLLVAVPGSTGTRFRMLETLREFGADRLAEQGLRDAAGLAHARHYAQVARDADAALRTPAQIEALATFDVERENLLAALACLGEQPDAEAAV